MSHSIKRKKGEREAERETGREGPLTSQKHRFAGKLQKRVLVSKNENSMILLVRKNRDNSITLADYLLRTKNEQKYLSGTQPNGSQIGYVSNKSLLVN